MSDTVKIDKTIIVKDKYGVTRQAFVAGDVVERHIYNIVLNDGTVVNPEDLPEEPNGVSLTSFNVKQSRFERKELPEEDEKPAKKAKK